MHAQVLERTPVADRYACINERRLDQIMERIFLPGRQIRAEIRNHHVPTGEHYGFAAGCCQRAAP
jgi:hypothetical protein